MSACFRWMLCAALVIAGASLSRAEEQADIPRVVREAVAAGDAVKDRRWAFIQTVTSGETAFVARFDARAPEAERWQLVSPEGEAVTENIRAAFGRIVENAKTRMPLGYLKLGETLAPGGTLEEAGPDAIVYRYRPKDMDGEAMRGELTIRTGRAAGPWVERVRIFAEKSYKPNFMTRVTRFEQTADYRLVADLPVLETAVTAVAGRAFFSSFEEEARVTISDAEIVE